MSIDAFTFEEAVREKTRARIALCGPSGSGKTFTALVLATGLANGGGVGLIDTEHDSAKKYAPPPSRRDRPAPGEFRFRHMGLRRYDPRDLPKALAAAAAAHLDVVVVDGMSAFWNKTGGMLEQVDAAAKRGFGGNQIGGWKETRPWETAMIEALLAFPGHVIVTMRVKTAYEIIEDDRGRKVPTKLGLKPEQREGIEYEFDVVGDMDLANNLTISKTRCSALAGQVISRPDVSLARVIAEWCDEGKEMMDATGYRDALCGPTLDTMTVKAYGIEIKDRGLNAATVEDEHGEPVTLRDLALRKYAEAQADAASVRDGAAADTGATGLPDRQRAPAEHPPGAAKPAARKRQQAASNAPVTDQEWLTGITSKALVFTGITESEGLRMEIAAMQANGGCTEADAVRLSEILDTRAADLLADAEAEHVAAEQGALV